MNIIKIISIILIIIICLLGVEFIIKFKRNINKNIEDIRKSLLTRITIIIIFIVILGIVSFINIFISTKPTIIKGINNYDKDYYIDKYGNDLDSNLSIFPDDIKNKNNSTFVSSMHTSLFDTDGYIILKVKYDLDEFYKEINRIKNISMNINSCDKDNKVVTNNIKYDETSYKYPSYITIDGFGYTYEYCLINKDKLEIIYIYLSYPYTNNSNYKEYLKKDKSYYKKDTLNLYSMYNHSFDNGNSFIEYNDCEK